MWATMSHDMVPAHNVTTTPTKIRLPMRSLPFDRSARCGSRRGRLGSPYEQAGEYRKISARVETPLFYTWFAANATKLARKRPKRDRMDDLYLPQAAVVWANGDIGQEDGVLTLLPDRVRRRFVA